MRMDKPKKYRNHNSLTNVFAISVTITFLTFGALTIDPLLVVATGEVEDEEEENRNTDSSVSNDTTITTPFVVITITSSIITTEYEH